MLSLSTYLRFNIRQTTWPACLVQTSAEPQTDPQVPFTRSSTRPWYGPAPPTRRTLSVQTPKSMLYFTLWPLDLLVFVVSLRERVGSATPTHKTKHLFRNLKQFSLLHLHVTILRIHHEEYHNTSWPYTARPCVHNERVVQIWTTVEHAEPCPPKPFHNERCFNFSFKSIRKHTQQKSGLFWYG